MKNRILFVFLFINLFSCVDTSKEEINFALDYEIINPSDYSRTDLLLIDSKLIDQNILQNIKYVGSDSSYYLFKERTNIDIPLIENKNGIIFLSKRLLDGNQEREENIRGIFQLDFTDKSIKEITKNYTKNLFSNSDSNATTPKKILFRGNSEFVSFGNEIFKKQANKIEKIFEAKDSYMLADFLMPRENVLVSFEFRLRDFSNVLSIIDTDNDSTLLSITGNENMYLLGCCNNKVFYSDEEFHEIDMESLNVRKLEFHANVDSIRKIIPVSDDEVYILVTEYSITINEPYDSAIIKYSLSKQKITDVRYRGKRIDDFLVL